MLCPRLLISLPALLVANFIFAEEAKAPKRSIIKRTTASSTVLLTTMIKITLVGRRLES
jgi:hypothetical protein